MSRRRWPRLGLRREIQILLPVTVFLLVLISGFTLFAYRSAIDLSGRGAPARSPGHHPEDRHRSCRGPLAHTHRAASTGPSRQSHRHCRHHRSPAALLRRPGDRQPAHSAAGPTLTRAVAFGPGAAAGDTVMGFAPFRYQDQSFILRLEMPAMELSRQRQGVGVLTWVVLPTSVALLMLALLFLPHFLKPYDTLVEQVQRVAPDSDDQDDVSMLVSTVDKALAALAAASKESLRGRLHRPAAHTGGQPGERSSPSRSAGAGPDSQPAGQRSPRDRPDRGTGSRGDLSGDSSGSARNVVPGRELKPRVFPVRKFASRPPRAVAPWDSRFMSCDVTTARSGAISLCSSISRKATGKPKLASSPPVWSSSVRWPQESLMNCATAWRPCVDI